MSDREVTRWQYDRILTPPTPISLCELIIVVLLRVCFRDSCQMQFSNQIRFSNIHYNWIEQNNIHFSDFQSGSVHIYIDMKTLRCIVFIDQFVMLQLLQIV